MHNGCGDVDVETKADPPGTKRNSEGQLIDEKTGRYVKDPNTVDYNRSMSERKKALLRDANDPNSGLSQEARDYILEHNGNKVPPGYEVAHKTPLYTEKTPQGKESIDTADNMHVEDKQVHRDAHRKCGNDYHAYPPADYRGK